MDSKASSTLQTLAQRAAELGYRKGESAAQFALRDPKAAAALDNLMQQHKEAIISEISDRRIKS